MEEHVDAELTHIEPPHISLSAQNRLESRFVEPTHDHDAASTQSFMENLTLSPGKEAPHELTMPVLG